MDIKKVLAANNLFPDPLKDQFFLTDEKVIKEMVGLADLNKKDIVLEIGTGLGNLTREIAKKSGKVIAFEFDVRFKPFLENLPPNVEIHFDDAWDYVQLHGKFKKKKEYNKVVSNLPYSFCEKFLHNLTFLEYDKIVLLVPKKIITKINSNGVFSSFFRAEEVLEVGKDKFYPAPKTDSAIIFLHKLADPIKTKNLANFLRQYIYQHEGQLVKNSLMEGLISYYSLVLNIKLSKNDAREMIRKKNLPSYLLDKRPYDLNIYQLVSREFRLVN